MSLPDFPVVGLGTLKTLLAYLVREKVPASVIRDVVDSQVPPREEES